jgi:hypothetical protein
MWPDDEQPKGAAPAIESTESSESTQEAGPFEEPVMEVVMELILPRSSMGDEDDASPPPPEPEPTESPFAVPEVEEIERERPRSA